MPREVLTDSEIGTPWIKKIINDAFEKAVEQKLFSTEGDIQMKKPYYMARINLGLSGAFKYIWLIRIKSTVPKSDNSCFGSGLFKFVAVDRNDGKGLDVSVEQLAP